MYFHLCRPLLLHQLGKYQACLTPIQKAIQQAYFDPKLKTMQHIKDLLGFKCCSKPQTGILSFGALFFSLDALLCMSML